MTGAPRVPLTTGRALAQQHLDGPGRRRRPGVTGRRRRFRR
ncbi:hypothetical protein [Streptomyces dysideae]|nr:hypothetical protein [Streptomyces dysideae]